MSLYNIDDFLNFLVDVYILSRADFLVCTFTSNVGRFAYELMQSYNREMDNSFKVKSLDNNYYFNSFNTFTKLVILDHTPNNIDEIELKIGDIIILFVRESPKYLAYSANIWNGYMQGTNERTMKNGKFPSYKVVDWFVKTKKNYAL